MPQVQTRLDLPHRRTRSKAGKVVTPVKLEEVSRGEENTEPKSTRRRGVLKPIEDDPEKLLRTPRSRRKPVSASATAGSADNTPIRNAAKRGASKTKDLEEETKVSPTKQTRTPLKQIKDQENVCVGLSPCSGLSRLALNSPKVNLSTKKETNVSKSKAELFKSPGKLSTNDVCNLLDSPEKPKTPSIKTRTPIRKSLIPTPTKSLFPSKSPRQLTTNQLEDLLCSPKRSVKTTNQPPSSKATANLFQSPSKSKSKTPVKKTSAASSLFPTKSPRRVTSQQLEDLLCSPVKSPAPRLPTKSPRKPATPSKLGSSPLKRTALFSPAKKSPVPSKPVPAQSQTVDIAHFQEARAALHTGTPSELLCRESQVQTMETWLDQHLVAGNPGSMYISGAPGTGKTATLTHLLESKVKKEYKSIFINCMVLKSSIAIYREVAKQLSPKKEAKTEKDALKTIENCIRNSKMMILLVLDEVDQLESKDQSVLYTVFEWPALQGSNLVLVGIANSLDLTDRVLPRLQVSPAYRPALLHYPPYTKQEIMDIITARLREACARDAVSGQPVITARAIAFLAGKIASLSGDLRKALDVCRRALELSETIARKQSMLKPLNPRALASPSKSPRKGYLTPKAVAGVGQVDVPQIMKVINQVYGSQVTASLGTKGDGLPLKQKILIASLLLMVKKGRSKEVTLGKLKETYSKVLKNRQMEPEHESACVGMIEMLESRGMVTYVCKGAPRMAKVTLRMDEDEVSMALGDKCLLAAILEDVSCIAK